LGVQKLDKFDCVIAHSGLSSEVVWFPFNSHRFVSPVRPFDVLFEDYITSEAEELTGVAVDGSMVYVQFETGAVVGLEIAKDEPACRHFIASVQRGASRPL
jgi:hypothetical protein